MVPPRHLEPEGEEEPRLTAAERSEIRRWLKAPHLTPEQYEEILEVCRNEQFRGRFWTTIRLWVGWLSISVAAIYGTYEAVKKMLPKG